MLPLYELSGATMQFIPVNWKTTLGGIAAILGAVADIMQFAVQHSAVSPHIGVDLSAIASGIGLIFAKDHVAAPVETSK